jgi:hypothetical protein
VDACALLGVPPQVVEPLLSRAPHFRVGCGEVGAIPGLLDRDQQRRQWPGQMSRMRRLPQRVASGSSRVRRRRGRHRRGCRPRRRLGPSPLLPPVGENPRRAGRSHRRPRPPARRTRSGPDHQFPRRRDLHGPSGRRPRPVRTDPDPRRSRTERENPQQVRHARRESRGGRSGQVPALRESLTIEVCAI